jgi:hypothetical protein
MAALWVTIGLLGAVFIIAFIALDLFSDELRRRTPYHVDTKINGYVDKYTGKLTRTRYPVKGPPP